LYILCPNRRVEIPDLPLKYRPVDTLVDLDLDSEPELAEPLSEFAAEADVDALLEADDGSALLMLTQTDSAELLAELPAEGLDLREHLFTIERSLIQQALLRSGGTVAHAARLLKLRRTTLVEKLRKFEMLNETAAAEV
jgi:sigma-54 specific flagellar transcriptional regulator A